jgi:hypothetical protein
VAALAEHGDPRVRDRPCRADRAARSPTAPVTSSSRPSTRTAPSEYRVGPRHCHSAAHSTGIAWSPVRAERSPAMKESPGHRRAFLVGGTVPPASSCRLFLSDTAAMTCTLASARLTEERRDGVATGSVAWQRSARVEGRQSRQVPAWRHRAVALKRRGRAHCRGRRADAVPLRGLVIGWLPASGLLTRAYSRAGRGGGVELVLEEVLVDLARRACTR